MFPSFLFTEHPCRFCASLDSPLGTITSLTFPSPSHLLSTSEDATITVFRTRDWVPLRTLKGHTGKVNCVDVHPSGKVALSVGRDQTLRMWDLMRGRGASSLGLGFGRSGVWLYSRGCWGPLLIRREPDSMSLM